MLLGIEQYGSQVLKLKCRAVEPSDLPLTDLVQNMFETMYAAEGIGLAAPQVGVPLQLVVIDIPVEDDSTSFLQVNGEDRKLSDIMPMAFYNPVLDPYGSMGSEQEGCLSVNKIRASVMRPSFVKANLTLLDGTVMQLDCNGLLARCLQHECDHLNGVLFVDRVSSAQKITLRNKLKRLSED